MKIHDARYLISAPNLNTCPDLGGAPEVVLIGRSNVGKSSFINSMLQRKNLARTSNTPGKTRYLNFYEIVYARPGTPGGKTDRLIFVDLPGYGYARVSASEQEAWRKNMELYLSQRPFIRLAIQLIDARHGPQESDFLMMEWLQHHGRRVQVILTKTDKLKRGQIAGQSATTAKVLDVATDHVIPYSSHTHTGRDAAWRALLSAIDGQAPHIAFNVASQEALPQEALTTDSSI